MELTAIALWLNTACASFDAAVTTAVHGLYNLDNGVFFTPFFTFISFFGKGGALLILLSAALMFFPRTRRVGTAMLLALGVGALLTNLVLKPLVLRPRPYTHEDSVYYQVWLLVGQHTESDYSFPSGHTTAAFASMTALFLMGDRRKSWTAFIFAVLMGVSRLYLGVHYMTDVLGGVVCGAAGGVAGYYIALILPSAYYSWRWKGAASSGGKHLKRE